MVAKFQIDSLSPVSACKWPVALSCQSHSDSQSVRSRFNSSPSPWNQTVLNWSSQLVSDRLACSAALPSIEGLLSSSQAAASKQRIPCEMESQWLLEMLPNANHFHWILNVNISLWFHQSEAMLTTVMWTLEHLQSMWHVNIWALQQQKDHANLLTQDAKQIQSTCTHTKLNLTVHIYICYTFYCRGLAVFKAVLGHRHCQSRKKTKK